MRKFNVLALTAAVSLAVSPLVMAQSTDTTIKVRQFLQPDQSKKGDTATFTFTGACKGRMVIDLTSAEAETYRGGYWDEELQQWVENEHDSIRWAGFVFYYTVDKLGGKLISNGDYSYWDDLAQPVMYFNFESKN